jgi:preprotein translocase subunit SecG
MMTFILIVHSLVCVLLLLAVLMQAGRGGGLTEQFQGAESVFGAQTNVFMVRTTSILATIFFITCLLLAFMSSRQERSLMAEHLPAKKAAAAGMTIPAQEPGSPAAGSAPVEPPPVATAPGAETPVTTNAQ